MEFIGLFIAGVLFFALSVVIGCVYGGVASLILGSQKDHRKFRWIAACLPPVFAAYMIGCAILFAVFIPGEGDRIFFGDLYERLPNGYTVTAMAKMPDYGCVHDDPASALCVNGTVGSLAVEGPFVFGAYSHKEGYFALDTRNGTNLDFAMIAELDRHAGHPVNLTDTFSFRSLDERRGLLQNIERSIWFGPPLICSVFYFAFLVKLRRRE
jgi:hypothetical protein